MHNNIQKEEFPLSDLQQAYLIGKKYSSKYERTGCHIYYEIKETNLNVEKLQNSWNELIRNHEMLRDLVLENSKQCIQPETTPYRFKVYDVKQFDDVRNRMSNKIYNAGDYPLYEIAITKINEEEWIIHISMDEWIVDAVSISILFRQWYCLYHDIIPEYTQYEFKNYINERKELKNSNRYRNDLEYWKKKFKLIDDNELSILIKNNEIDGHRNYFTFCFDKEKSDILMKIANSKKVSPTVIFFTLFKNICNKYIENRQVPIILTLSDRFSAYSGIENAVGPFINTAIFISDNNGKMNSIDLQFEEIQNEFWEINDHRCVSGIDILRELKKDGLVNTKFTIPIVFTSMLSSVGEQYCETWYNKVVYNVSQTPQVYLDFQLSSVNNKIKIKWDFLENVFRNGVVKNMFDDYISSINKLIDIQENNNPLTMFQYNNLFFRNKKRLFYQAYKVQNDSSARIVNKWKEIIDNTDALRMVYDLKKNKQKITEAVYNYKIIDLKNESRDNKEKYLKKNREELINTEFKLFEQPRFELRIIELQENELLVCFIFDSALIDGRSFAIIIKEMLDKDYVFDKERMSFTDYLYLLNFEKKSELRADYWKNKVSNLLDGPRLGCMDSSAISKIERISKVVPFTNEINEYTQKKNIDRNSFLLAVFMEVIYEIEKKPFTISVVGWERNDKEYNIKNTIGEFTNIDWINYSIEHHDLEDMILDIDAELQTGIKMQSEEMLKHFTRLKEKPILPVVFTKSVNNEDLYLNHRIKQIDGLSITPNVDFDFICLADDEKITINWDYNTEVYNKEIIEELFEKYYSKISQFMTSVKKDDKWKYKSIHEYVEFQAKKNGEKCAVKCGDQTITYNELNQKANKLANYLRKESDMSGKMICICMEKSVKMIIAILAVLKSGAAYVPIDSNYPQERISYIISDCNAAVTLISDNSKAKIEQYNINMINIDLLDLNDENDENIDLTFNGSEIAYVIYTSGSTGKPKGVLIPHYNVVRLFKETDHWFSFNDRDVWTMFHSFAFDFSVWEIWGALLYGGKLLVIPYALSRSFSKVYNLLYTENVTVFNQTPTAFEQILKIDNTNTLDLKLRYIIFGGETLKLSRLKDWFINHGEKTKLINMYGITETTVHVTYREIREKDTSNEQSLIGEPIKDLKLYILNDNHEIVKEGEVGEICISGPGLAKEYLNCPQLTMQKFIENPFEEGTRLYLSGDLGRYTVDGDIEYMGRKDSQVKIRGFRIELGEIETVLNNNERIERSVVVVGEGDQKQIKAFVLCKEKIKEVDIRKFTRKFLPDYMIPNVIEYVDEIPMTINGKVDYKKLNSIRGDKKMSIQNEKKSIKMVEVDEIIEYLKKELEVDELNIDDDIFDYGATSLTIVNCMNWMKNEKKIDVEIDVFLEHPVIRDLVKCLNDCERKDNSVPLDDVENFKTTIGDSVQISLNSISELLGLLKSETVDGKVKYIYASAGGKNAVQIYIYIKRNAIEGIEEGVYYYNPEEHILCYISDGSTITDSIYPEFCSKAFEEAGFAIFLIAELKAIEPVYLEFSRGLVTIDSGYIKQLLLSKKPDQLHLISVDSIDFSQIATDFCLGESHFVISGLLGRNGPFSDSLMINNNFKSNTYTEHFESEPIFITKEYQESLLKQMKYNTLTRKEIVELARKKLHIRKFNNKVKQIPLLPVFHEKDIFINRCSKRKYENTEMNIEQILGMIETLYDDNHIPIYHSVSKKYTVEIYVYLKNNVVKDYSEGIYKYNYKTGKLDTINNDIDVNFELCHTPFNRPHFKQSGFSIYLIADMKKAKEYYGSPYLMFTLSESGSMGYLLMESQKKNNIGLVPIGGMNFEKIKNCFNVSDQHMLLHSFIGGSYTYNSQKDIQNEKQNILLQNDNEDIAIVGIGGCFPDADNINMFWENIKNGKNCIKEFPQNRINADTSLNGLYGGFIDGIDRFDAKMFGIMPDEAQFLDPQVRIFLKTTYEALYDSGFEFESDTVNTNYGVYVGSMYQHYHLLGNIDENFDIMTIQSYSSIANRTSFYFNFSGPSIAIDSACSSSFSALEIAVDNLKNNKIYSAVVGGINLTLHSSKYSALDKMGLLSHKDKVHCFGNGDGFIPGEGCGVIILKRLSDAINNSNHIYGVIKAVNTAHTGKTKAYSMPNVSNEKTLINRTIENAGLTINDIDYIESSANGTVLGDSAEYAALRDTFEKYKKEHVYLGSVKACIGHLEAASGMAQIMKVVLQLRYGLITPTININEMSSLINTTDSKIFINTELREWCRQKDGKHVALINNFAAGGNNACAIIEEYIGNDNDIQENDEFIIPITAKNKKMLFDNIDYLIEYSEKTENLDISDIEYTLMTQAFYNNIRVAVICKNVSDLIDKLRRLKKAGKSIEGVWFSCNSNEPGAYRVFKEDQRCRDIVKQWIKEKNLCRLAELWSHGVDINWNDKELKCTGARLFLVFKHFEEDHFWINDNSTLINKTITGKENEILKFLNSMFNVHEVTEKRNEKLKDYGFNSISAIRIISFLNEKGNPNIELPQLMSCETIGELLDIL